MTFEFRDAVRKDVGLLILLAGGSGSGKTESAMRLATGLAGGKVFGVIDTENGRALHKADDYRFKHLALDEPFSPERYIEAVKLGDKMKLPVLAIDSGSHEWEGVGGVLDLQAEEFERMGRKDSARMASWIAPKQRHKRFVQTLLRSPAHVILCLRAEDKVEMVKEDGKTVVRAKQSLIGAQGWVPIVEKRLPFEATISLLLLQANPGVPVPIKLEGRHRDMIPLDRQLDESVGNALAAWAAGGPRSRSPRAGEALGAEAGPTAASEASPAPDEDQPIDAQPFQAPSLDEQLAVALKLTFPLGPNQGKTIAEAVASPSAKAWAEKALRIDWQDEGFTAAVQLVCEHTEALRPVFEAWVAERL
ncbi:MAG: AAA family ATPase [Solirubrobacterales bacterium]|nr:AAA family ATPase [Solirubrobacterales bacterium]